VACRDKLSNEEIEALWKPIDRAIPLTTLDAKSK
jgi:hypothetical protein